MLERAVTSAAPVDQQGGNALVLVSACKEAHHMLLRIILFTLSGVAILSSVIAAGGRSDRGAAGLSVADVQQYIRRNPNYLAIIGDSITALAPEQLVHGQKVLRLAYGGAQIEGVRRNRVPLMLQRAPRALIVAIGVNDSQRGIQKPRDQLLADVAVSYRALLREAQALTPRVAVVLSPPVGRGQPMGDVFFDPNLIVAINAIMTAAAAEFEIPVLALSDLADADGFAREDVTLDGVHLSAAGYAIWTSVIEQAFKVAFAAAEGKAVAQQAP
jgi:lysophospholipase L1-like esterase